MLLNVLLVLNVAILSASLERNTANEFVVVSTSQSPEEEMQNKSSDDTNRHLLALLTQMVEVEKSSKRNDNCAGSIKEQLAQVLKKLQQLETEHQERLSKLEQNLETKNQTLDQVKNTGRNLEERITEMQQQLDQQEATIKEQRDNISRIEQSLNDNKKSSEKLPRNCDEIKERAESLSGIYLIQPKSEYFKVLCDMETYGGGWTVIQNRYDGSQDFLQNWTDYKKGFGNLYGEFWLGLDHLYDLTEANGTELLIKLVDRNFKEAYATYGAFRIDNQDNFYALKEVGRYRGTAGDSLSYHVGAKFSTKNSDNSGHSCATQYPGAWWFKYCVYSNLNGKYSHDGKTEGKAQGINWYHFSTDNYSLLKSKMMVRPRRTV